MGMPEGSAAVNDGANDNKDLWQRMLKENASRSTQEVRTVLIVGDANSGKKALWSRFHGKHLDEAECSPLHYAYSEVQLDDVDADDIARVDIWALKGGFAHEELALHVLDKTSIRNACILLCVNLEEPKSVAKTLDDWGSRLEKMVGTAQGTMDPADIKQLHEKVLARWRAYKPPSTGETAEGADGAGVTAVDVVDGEPEEQPLPSGVATINYGVPLIVVGTKSDTVEAQMRTHGLTEQKWDCLQHMLRKFCLTHGASLIYTSVPTACNCDLLWDMTLNTLGVPRQISTAAQVLARESVFVPAGWDSMDKIDVVMDEATAEQTRKTLVGTTPASKSKDTDAETALDDHEFVSKAKAALVTAGAGRSTARTSRPAVPQKETPSQPKEQDQAANSGATEAAAGVGGKKPVGDQALNTFFHSLLARPTATAKKSDRATESKQAQIRSEAGEALDKLRGDKPSS